MNKQMTQRHKIIEGQMIALQCLGQFIVLISNLKVI